ncbi:conserved hypothetical protein, secreted [Candidatus Magnetomorum sp. HK-1]|nr:conserved hypothetical protein, secreted [Candidatus Magnetomorum sp. HK-1]
MKRTAAILFLCMIIQSCLFSRSDNILKPLEESTSSKDRFTQAYKLFSQHQYNKALPVFHEYLKIHGPDDDNFAWALFFFGISLKENGFTYAAFDIFSQLIDQSPNAKIVTHVLGLFESAMLKGQISDNYIRKTAFCSKNFAFIEAPLSDFIDFQQGMCNWEKGYIEWGNEHFRQIPLESLYYEHYRIEHARLMVLNNENHKAIAVLEDILKSKKVSKSIQSKAQITLARLYYGQKDYIRADQLYIKIAKYHSDQARFLLERAWTQFHMGHLDIALGLLTALNAPDFKNQITPEYFLLKSLIYKNVCNYQNALSIVDEFQNQYQDILSSLKERRPLDDHIPALQLLSHEKKISDLLIILKQLEYESKMAKSLTNKSLVDDLISRYQILMNKYIHQIKKNADYIYVKLADQLLTYEENMRLMHYEIGLDMYQRVKQVAKTLNKASAEMTADNPVIYPFINEYWNDELDHLRVSLTDHCQTLEEWDIFFK